MRTTLLAIAVILLAAQCAGAAVTDATPCGVCNSCESRGGCCCDPVWTVHADALFLHRSTPRDVLLVRNSDRLPLTSAGEFDFQYDAGWQIGLTRRFNERWSIEGNYFKVDSWNATATPVVSALGTYTQYVDPVGSDTETEMLSSYRSELESVEVNLRRDVGRRLDLIFGFRFIELADGNLALVNYRGGQEPYVSTHLIDANNCLYGFQLGADAKVLSWGRFGLGTVLKAGIYGNNAHNAVSIADPDPHFACAAAANHAAFEGELGITASYQLTKALSVEAGYQLLWLEGVACASDQVPVSDPYHGTGGITFNGSPFYNGAFVGLVLTR
jgi:hypothetical protein